MMRALLFKHLFINAYEGRGISPFNRLMAVLILFGVLISILDTEITLRQSYGPLFQTIEFYLAILFGIEYIFRVWAVAENEAHKSFRGRLKYIFSPMAIIDLLAFIPCLITLGATDSLLFRIVRLGRLIRFAKLGQYTSSLRLVADAINTCWRELIVSFAMATFLLIVCSAFLYVLEGSVQPEAFGSIPRAMWCAVSTLTTFGYGDVYPITALGKVFMGAFALICVGLVGMPTAILAGAFSSQFSVKKTKDSR